LPDAKHSQPMYGCSNSAFDVHVTSNTPSPYLDYIGRETLEGCLLVIALAPLVGAGSDAASNASMVTELDDPVPQVSPSQVSPTQCPFSKLLSSLSSQAAQADRQASPARLKELVCQALQEGAAAVHRLCKAVVAPHDTRVPPVSLQKGPQEIANDVACALDAAVARHRFRNRHGAGSPVLRSLSLTSTSWQSCFACLTPKQASALAPTPDQ